MSIVSEKPARPTILKFWGLGNIGTVGVNGRKRRNANTPNEGIISHLQNMCTSESMNLKI